MIIDSTHRIVTVLIAGVLAGALCAGCERRAGPAEQAGKQLDEATSRAGEKIEQMGDDLHEAVEGAN